MDGKPRRNFLGTLRQVFDRHLYVIVNQTTAPATAGAISKKDFSQMKHSEAVASFKRHAPGLGPDVHKILADGLDKDGLLERDGVLRAAAARHCYVTISAAMQDRTKYPLAKQAIGMLRAMGADDIDLEKPIQTADLDRKLRRRETSTLDRIAIKDLLYKLGCIPA